MDQTKSHLAAPGVEPRDPDLQHETPGNPSGDLPPDIAKIAEDEGDAPEFDLYINRPKPPLLVVLTGPSGVGKDATLQAMAAKGIPFHYVVTVTTRAIRAGEIEGVHYFFKTRERIRNNASKQRATRALTRIRQLLWRTAQRGSRLPAPWRGRDNEAGRAWCPQNARSRAGCHLHLPGPSQHAVPRFASLHRKTEDPESLPTGYSWPGKRCTT